MRRGRERPHPRDQAGPGEGRGHAQRRAEDPETGLIWSRVALEAWVQKGNLLPNPAALTAYGDEMYRGACSGCHALPPPGHTLANQWPGVLNAMKRFISLDDEEYRFLQKYLQLNAKDTGGKGHG